MSFWTRQRRVKNLAGLRTPVGNPIPSRPFAEFILSET